MRVHIFGASGSGVTTLGRDLAEKINVPYFDSDNYFWEKSDPPFTVPRQPAVRNEMLINDLIIYPDWILGGSMYAWGCTPDFDLAVFLWIPQELRIERLKAREYERYGDIIFKDALRNKMYNEFIEWAKGYDSGSDTASSRTLAAHEAWMCKLACPVLEIRQNSTPEEKTALVMDKLKNIPSHQAK